MVDSPPEAEPSGSFDRFLTAARSLRRPALALAVAALLLALARAWSFGTEEPPAAYYQDWVVGQALRAGDAGNIYDEDRRVQLAGRAWLDAHREARELGRETLRKQASVYRRYELGTYGTPWLYTTFGWSLTEDYDADQIRFQRVSLACFVVSVIVLTRLAGGSALHAALWALFSITLFAPVDSEIRVGNVNRIQLFLLTLGLVALRMRAPATRSFCAGLVLSLAILFKPSLAAVGLMLSIGWLLTRRFRELGFLAVGAGLGAAAAIGTSSAYFGGSEAWGNWLRELPPLLAEFDHNIRKGNFSLVRIAADGLDFGHSALFAGVFVVGTMSAVLVGRSFGRSGNGTIGSMASGAFWLDCLMVGLGGLMPVLASDLAWYHYYILTLPLFIFVLRPVPAPVGRDRIVGRTVALAALSCVATTPIRPFVGAPGPLVIGALVSFGALCLYGLALYELFDGARRSASANLECGAPT